MKIFVVFPLFFLYSAIALAQHISAADLKKLSAEEKLLQKPGLGILQDSSISLRFKSDSVFTRQLVHALKTSNSFYYPFDSLTTISKLYSPDSVFRIFTWQLVIDENLTRQHGAIQMRTTDGSLKLFPLIDKSDITLDFDDSIGNNFGWMGAVYYRVILTTNAGHKYYTLLGYDENNMVSTRKVIEMLQFVNNEPVFGGHFFRIPNDKLIAKSPARYVMEFKKDAGPRLSFDEDLNIIVIEHLVSQTNEPGKKYTLIGDGDYDGLRWITGKWVFVDKIFRQVTPEGQPPTPHTVRDDNGTIDNSKLKGREDEAPPKP